MIDYFKSVFKAIFPFLLKSPFSIELKNKIILIWKDVIGFPEEFLNAGNFNYYLISNDVYKYWTDLICRQYGYLTLNNVRRTRNHNYFSEMKNYFLTCNDIDEIKYAIFVSFAFVDGVIRKNDIYRRRNSAKIADDAIKYLNKLFNEYQIDLKYCAGNLISSDGASLYEETVKSSISLLSDNNFKSAEKDLSIAHERYCSGLYRDSIIYCASAFESTIKVVLKRHDIVFKDTDTIHCLLDKYLKAIKLPDFAKRNFIKLKEFIESLTILRNDKGPHGKSEIEVIPSYYALYMFQMTDATIKFVIEADKQS